MRTIAFFLPLSLALLTACQDKHEQVMSPAAPESAGTANGSPPVVHNSPPARGVGQSGELAMHPETPSRIVTDTTPVDTQVADVKLSDNGDEKMLTGLMTDQFKPHDAVFLSIRTRGTANKYTLSAKWLTPSGETLTEYSQALTAAGVNDTIFSLSKPDGWANGQYRVELSINGKLLKTVPFTVH